MSTETLQQAYRLITKGNNAEAIRILTPLLKADRDNKHAWWLLANAASKPEQIEFALKNVLRIDPFHAQAQAKLDQLHAQSAAEFFSTVNPDEPESVDAATLSYFGTTDASEPSDTEDWGKIDSQALVVNSPTSTVSPRSTASLPLYPPLEQRSQRDKGMSANFVFGVAGLALVGACVILFILYSAGAFDGLLGILPPAPDPKAGWYTYHGNGMTVQLPEDWDDFDASANADELLDVFEEAFPEYSSQVELARSDPDLYRFFAVDSTDSSTNMIVTSESVGIFMSLDTYMDVNVKQLNGPFTILSQTVREIEPFGEVGVIETRATIYGVSIRQILYVIKRRTRVWGIAFSTEAGLFEGRRDEFEYILTTFRPD